MLCICGIWREASTSHLTVMYLYARGWRQRGVWRTLFSGGGGGPQGRSALLQGLVRPSRVHHRSTGVLALPLPPSSPSYSGCVQGVEDHVRSTGNTHGSLVCEPTHNAELALLPSWGAVMAHMGSEATLMAYSFAELAR